MTRDEILDAAREIVANAARLAVMAGALEYIAESHDAGRHDGLPEECPAHEQTSMWLCAREALTTLPERAKAMLAVRKAAKETDEAEAALWPDGPPLGAEDLHNAVVTIREALKQLETK